MVMLERYNLESGIHRVKIMKVELVDVRGYEAIKLDVLNNTNGGREVLIFLSNKQLLSQLVSLIYVVDEVEGYEFEYEIDEKEFEGMIVYINLVLNDKGYIVLDEITNEEGYQNYLKEYRGE